MSQNQNNKDTSIDTKRNVFKDARKSNSSNVKFSKQTTTSSMASIPSVSVVDVNFCKINNSKTKSKSKDSKSFCTHKQSQQSQSNQLQSNQSQSDQLQSNQSQSNQSQSNLAQSNQLQSNRVKNVGVNDGSTTSSNNRLIIYAHKKAYDVTDFVSKHPAGSACILKKIGQDCTVDYDFHSKNAKDIWGIYQVKSDMKDRNKNCVLM